MSIKEIKAEVVDNCISLAVNPELIEKPFDRILQLGLSVFPGCRNMSVEQLRDMMCQVVVDRVSQYLN